MATAFYTYANDQLSGSIETGMDFDWFKFTVTDSTPGAVRMFKIYTMGTTDTYGELYNANGEWIHVNDDGGVPQTGSNLNFWHGYAQPKARHLLC